MQERQEEAFVLAQKIAGECAIAYKHALLEKTGKMVLFNAKKTIPPLIYWTLFYLHMQMMKSYRVYHPVPPGVWQEMHVLHRYAEEQGYVGEGNGTDTGLTIHDLYTEALMVALADPYRLMQREIDRALEVLQQNRGLVDLRDSAEGLNPQRLFVVAQDSDAPPRVLVQGNRPPPGNLLRLVDPSKLVEKLQQRLRPAKAAAVAKGRGAHDPADLLARLIRLWGDPPKRQFRRSPTDSAVALCSGIKAICHFTELALNEDPEADAKAIRDGDTIPLIRIPDDDVSRSIGVESWQVLNQSANGLRLHRESGGRVAITVGDVIGVRFVGGRTWNVGIVRWLTLLEGSSLEFGVELVAPAAKSIVIEPTIGGGRPIPALRLYPLMPGAESDTLMTATDTFADLREFELREIESTSLVRATTLIERTSRFDMFQFQES
ncbi:MAG TPA: hypothetical protein VFV17_02280 [Usitatibacteraceae bacterium]|nr:hypothetical protein [Usitatibacteraceae bacterium]